MICCRQSHSLIRILSITSLLKICVCWELRKATQRFVCCVGLATCCLLADPYQIPAAAKDFDFSNGHVRIDDPLTMNLENGILRLNNPLLIGYGGGGSVYTFDGSDIVVKISWANSADSVRRECRTLQYLESKSVTCTERCLGFAGYEYDDSNRVMIAVSPYVADAVASVGELSAINLQAKAVQQISQTLVQMLAHNIVTIDVQPLISQATGDVIFIDMTEAQVLRPPFSFLDQTLMGSFCSEMIALIPEQFANLAAACVRDEVKRLAAQGTLLSNEAQEVLYSQTFFFSED